MSSIIETPLPNEIDRKVAHYIEHNDKKKKDAGIVR